MNQNGKVSNKNKTMTRLSDIDFDLDIKTFRSWTFTNATLQHTPKTCFPNNYILSNLSESISTTEKSGFSKNLVTVKTRVVVGKNSN